jgi:phosphate transport system substrate-binding protein
MGLACAVLAVVPVGCGGCNKKPRLTGGGSSFVDPMMRKWSGEYAKKDAEVDYTRTGSGDGVSKMIDKKRDFGCTDAPMNKEQLDKAKEKGGEVIHVPLVMGAVVPIYNLPDFDKKVHFTGKALAKIYMGEWTNWKDLRDIHADNKDLPDLKISVVHRGEPSGTTHIFTSFLHETSPDVWKEAPSTSPTWKLGESPTGGNQAVAKAVENKKGAIGYVELLYALRNKGKISYGLVKNQEGEYPEPTTESVTKAAAGKLQNVQDDLRFSLVNAPGKGAYPISGATWAVCYVKQPKDKAKLLKDFLWWATHDGQEFCEAEYYARLPKGLVEKIEKKLETIKGE